MFSKRHLFILFFTDEIDPRVTFVTKTLARTPQGKYVSISISSVVCITAYCSLLYLFVVFISFAILKLSIKEKEVVCSRTDFKILYQLKLKHAAWSVTLCIPLP